MTGALVAALLCVAAPQARAADFDDDAARISRDLVRQAQQSQISRAEVVVPRDWAPELGLTPISLNEAKALFDHFKSQDELMWQYVEEGCFARAHLMAHEMERKRGIISDREGALRLGSRSGRPPHDIDRLAKKLDIFKGGSIRFVVLPRFAFRYGRKYEHADRWNPSELSEARQKLEQLDNEQLSLDLFLRRNITVEPAM